MNKSKEKDPLRQWQGKVSKAKGKHFEERLDAAFLYYDEKGFASIEKTPEPMKPAKSLGNGKFVAFFEKKAQPDYKGTIKGGRAVMFEAKYTDSEKMEQSRVNKDQTEYLEKHHNLGARCYVLIGFGSGEVYKIPWDIWRNMKAIYGRKYLKETDIQNYKVKSAWNTMLMILE